MVGFDWAYIKATPDNQSNASLFYLIPVGLREVAIQHIESQRYIAINKRAKLIAKETITLYFKEKGDYYGCDHSLVDAPIQAIRDTTQVIVRNPK